MTQALVEKTCTPCRGGMPPLTRAEAEELLPQAPEWALMDDAHRIEKTFRFGNFREVLVFVLRLASLRRRKVTIPTSPSAGAMGPCRFAPRRSRVSTRTISSWRQRSIDLRRRRTKLLEHAFRRSPSKRSRWVDAVMPSIERRRHRARRGDGRNDKTRVLNCRS